MDTIMYLYFVPLFYLDLILTLLCISLLLNLHYRASGAVSSTVMLALP